jgi:hypothetical protein
VSVPKLAIIEEVSDELFELPSLRRGMLLHYKGAKKHQLDGFNLMKKSDAEMSSLRKFACKFGGQIRVAI